MSTSQNPWEGGAGGDLTLSNAMGAPVPAPSPSYLHSAPSTSTADITGVPALPPRPQLGSQMVPSYGTNVGYSPYGGMNTMGTYGMGAMGAMGGYGAGGYGYGGGYGGFMGGMSPYGGFNRFGSTDLESRFIQMAEESSRPAFDSIGGVVQAVGSVAMMLDSTFLALTSSFRAILGVAENFGRLRSMFAQMWTTLAVVRSLNWLVRRLLVVMGVRTEGEFKAWAAAVAETQGGGGTPEQRRRASSWPVLLFFGVVAAAPYVIFRLMRGVAGSIHERLTEPGTWERPLRAVATHDFTATSPQEVSFRAGQVLHLAPQHLQGNLWNSGWLMASVDKQVAGLAPVNYIKVIRPTEPAEQRPAAPARDPDTKTSAESPAVNLNDIYNQEL